MYEPTRGGTRGGQAEFKWTDVSADKDRENYLGHSINAPTGRWQKNKDVHWYNRDQKSSEEERREEIRKVKEAEAEAMSVALGFKPSAKTGDGPTTGANAIAVPPKPTSGSPTADQPEQSEKEKIIEREIEKAQRSVEKQAKRERKEQKRVEKEARKAAKGKDKDRSPSRERDRRRDRSEEEERDRYEGKDRRRDGERDRYRARDPDSRDARRRSASPSSHDYKRRRESYSGPGPELSPTRSRSPYRRRYSDRDREGLDDGYRREGRR